MTTKSFIPFQIQMRGVLRVVQTDNKPDKTLLIGLARAFYWKHLIDSGHVASGSEIARVEKLHHSTVNELLRLTLLSPGIIEMFMSGHQPPTLTLQWFLRHPIPLNWAEQEAIIEGFR